MPTRWCAVCGDERAFVVPGCADERAAWRELMCERCGDALLVGPPPVLAKPGAA